jgi:L-seryl-tRNA(Ser) seleniumtransferase
LGKAVGKEASLLPGESEVGGGSFPGTTLKTWLVQIESSISAGDLAGRLRSGVTPVIARIADGHVVLDPRTILPDQIAPAARAVRVSLDA